MSYPLRGVLLMMLLSAQPALAQDLRLGMSAEPTSIDPLLFSFVPNNQVRAHIFDTLVYDDNHGRLTPGLAESWSPIDDTTWEFHLRAGIMFHDGAALTVEDVVFSIDRADKVPNSPGSFAVFTKGILGVDIIDTLTLRVRTKEPDAYVPFNLARIAIQAKHSAAGRKTEDFNSGVAAIGTGPYRFVAWSPGQPVELRRNDGYWGPKPDWSKVTLRPIKANATREIALLAGDVDYIESVPPQDAERLGSDPNLRIVRDLPFGVIMLALDQSRDNPLLMFDNDGRPLERNPFKDKRVRLAVSKAIDRDAIVRKIQTGAGVSASQLLPEGYFGVSTQLQAEKFDPDGARELLAEAGYPNGWRVTLHGLNDRYANDAAVAQAIAQMLTRIGIKTEVVALPGTIFFPKHARSEFSFELAPWFTSEMLLALKGAVATVDTARGWGSINRSGYSNPGLDLMLGHAQTTLDTGSREALLAKASEVAMEDLGVIPVYHPVPLLGMRRTIWFDVASTEHSLAGNIHRVKTTD